MAKLVTGHEEEMQAIVNIEYSSGYLLSCLKDMVNEVEWAGDVVLFGETVKRGDAEIAQSMREIARVALSYASQLDKAL